MRRVPLPARAGKLKSCDVPVAIDLVFYDGSCALCHRTVRFILRRDRAAAFRFAPLDGETFRARLGNCADMPDSLVLLTSSGAVLTRSDAVIHVLRRLGGIWRAAARFARLLPRPLRNGLYDVIARTRYRIFGREPKACPLVAPDLASRFLA
jgi:predicted DCC family thiol-disulfide oxidoreductase YuxK